MPENNKIFISYSRKNREFAKDLYKRLNDLGFDLWRDVHDIEAGADDWWQAIEDAIKGCHTLILCMSLPALKSPIVADEWMLARTEGKRIIPVVADDIWTHPEVESGDFVIPNWMTRQNWIDYRDGTPEAEAAWDNLIKTLNKDYEPKPFINMVPELPPRFVRRPELADRIIGKLVDDNRDAVAMTTALRGAGGYGKTTLAKAVTRDVRVQGAFDDGILWMTLGEELLSYSAEKLRTTLIQKAIDLIYGLTGQNEVINTLEMCHTKLNEAVGKRHILLVIDDVWDKRHLEPFLLDTENSSCIITTRSEDTVNRDDIQREPVDKMAPIEAAELLGAGIDPEEVAKNQESLKTLAHDLREYPLLLALANTQISNWMQDMDLSLAQAIEFARETLKERGVLGFDDTDTDARHDAVANTLEISLRQLSDQERTQYLELAIFPEDTAIPLTTLALYWGMTRVQTLQYCQKLFRKTALLHSFEGQAVRIHDVFRMYLLKQHDAAALRKLHEHLIGNYKDLTHLPDEYAWRNIAYHLKEVGQIDNLLKLLFTFDYLQNKLNATDPQFLIDDYELFENEDSQLMKSAISMSSHIIRKNKDLLFECLCKHLASYQFTRQKIKNLFDQVKEYCLIPVSQTFADPAGGALIRTIEGHTDHIYCVALSDRFAVSSSADGTLKVWNWTTGELIRTLTGENDSVNYVVLQREFAVTVQGSSIQQVDGEPDNTLKVWNWTTGELLRTLEGHRSYVNSVALVDEYAISVSDDCTLKVWNWTTGELLRTLEGHRNYVNSVALVNEYAVSASSDCTLKVWNWTTGELLRTLEGHESDVNSVALLDEFVVSASTDNTLQVWNWTTGDLLRTLEGHTKAVNAVALSNDKKLAISASADGTLKVWDWKIGKLLRTLQGHKERIWSVTLTTTFQSEYAISTSSDLTLKIWDWKKDFSPVMQTRLLEKHSSDVNSIELSNMNSFRYAISASSDSTLKIWHWDTDFSISGVHTLEGHNDSVLSVALSENETSTFAVSASSDRTLKIWHWDTDFSISGVHTLEGHNDSVLSVALSENETSTFAVSVSTDRTLRVWNCTTGQLVFTLEEFNEIFKSIALLGEFAVIACNDRFGQRGILKVWNWTSGQLVRTLEDNSEIFKSLTLMDEYAVTACGDQFDRYGTLNIWNWQTGELINKLEGHKKAARNVAVWGPFAISVSDDCTLKVWNWQTKELITTFTSDYPLYSVAIASDASIILTGDEMGNVHFLRPNSALLQLIRDNTRTIC